MGKTVSRLDRPQAWPGVLVIVALALAAYLPALRAGFIWDDPDYVVNNLNLRDAPGLADTWFSPRTLPQYYPLVHTTFWVEYQLWGLNPFGYHLVNVLLHIGSALLLWKLLSKLDVPGAWLAAAIFAVHPVHVESVAWVTERKNVLSLLLYLASAYVLLFSSEWRVSRGYWAALLLFVLALLSKSVVCTLPAAIVVVLWWKQGRVAGRQLALLVPFFIFGIAMALVTAWMEKHHVGADASRIAELDLSIAQRILVAGRVIWFYASKLVFPYPLVFIYPRWMSIDPTSSWQWLFPIGVIATFLLLYRLARRGVLVAALLFCGTLVPALGFFAVYPMRFSYVADHFQYHASVALIALIAAGLCAAARQTSPKLVAPLVLATLTVLTWRQCRNYRDAETLWRATLAHNETSWMVHTNLGHALRAKDPADFDGAELHYRRALELAPELHDTHVNVGMMDGMRGRAIQAIDHFTEALRINPEFAPAHYGMGQVFQREGRVEQAIASYRNALELEPGYPEAAFRLGVLMEEQANNDEAARLYRIAVTGDPENAEARYNLGAVLIKLRKFDEAIFNLKEAVRINPGYAQAWTNLGAAQLLSGDRGGAVTSFQQALAIDPTLIPARRGLDAAMGNRR